MALDTGEAVGRGALRHCCCEVQTGAATREVSMEILHKAEIDLLLDPAALKGLYIVPYKYCLMFIAAFSIVTNQWKQPRYPSTGERMMQCYTFTLGNVK